jgi:quinol monooxygenase YgiN
MVIIFVKIAVRPEKHKELSQTLHSIVEQVRKESGCEHASFYRNSEDEEIFGG